MASSRALTGGARCLNCRRQVLQSFIASFTPVTRTRHAPTRQASAPRRAFATSFALRNRISEDQCTEKEDSIKADAALHSSPTYKASESETPNPFSVSDIPVEEKNPKPPPSQDTVTDQSPWYLSPSAQEQVDPTSKTINPLLERQRLPPLPTSPPPILSPLLKHLSIDIGLDYLSLLDLRKMDPPPALGGNLFMIFGTARSEKHLNVAADRFCRWLRSTYKLRPYADGLLGRNELKLKLKRKNRRMRMLGAAGITQTQTVDYEDGIGTGWVCVNVGAVEGGSLGAGEEMETVSDEDVDGFVGFGGDAGDHSRIVVQMMTEERRGEIDLEALWSQALNRSLKAQKKIEAAAVESESEQSADTFEHGLQPRSLEQRASV